MNLRAKLAGMAAVSGLYWWLIFMAALGSAFCAAAMYLALVPPLGAPLAALIAGSTLLEIAGVTILVAAWCARRRKAPEQADLERLLGKLLDGPMAGWARRHAVEASVAALVAGVVTGTSPKVRKRAAHLIRELLED